MTKAVEKDCKPCKLTKSDSKESQENKPKVTIESKKEDGKPGKDCKACDTRRKSLSEKITSLLPLHDSKKSHGPVIVKNKGPKTLDDVQAKKDRKYFE